MLRNKCIGPFLLKQTHAPMSVRASPFSVVRARLVPNRVAGTPERAPIQKQGLALPCKPPAPRRVACSCEAATSTSSAVQTKRYVLSTKEARASLRMEPMQYGKNQMVVVTAVAVGSEAYNEGIRPGDVVTGISDPNRSDQIWKLNEMSSYRFVQFSFDKNMNDTLTMDITPGDSDALPFMDGVASPSASKDRDQEASAKAAQPTDSASSSLLDSVLESAAESASEGEYEMDTVAGRLERQYRKAQKQNTKVQDRIQARKAALAATGERNDSKLFAGIFLLAFLPPAVILAWAFSSGYLDSLAMRY
eukprot:TRINITY_DN21874_c0_g1_i2.p1 TRINITY_DN21874_c0_g1~~TRINITY_DN21874_c0_g1_i2.p1  ORF type:complete len:314 (-),score=34.64 TRINITY_DN21874_c0_g1_i2:220-1137(-)